VSATGGVDGGHRVGTRRQTGGRPAPGGPARVVVVDHQAAFLAGLAGTVDAAPDLTVVARGADAGAVAGRARARGADVAVVAIDSAEGVAALRPLQAACPGIRCVALEGGDDEGGRLEALADALRAGARGLVLRSDGPERLLAAVRAAAADETSWPPGALSRALDAVLRPLPASVEDERRLRQLTVRELEVLGCLLDGLGRSEIAERLVVSPHTARTHITNLLRKLEVHSCVAAVAVARRAGWADRVLSAAAT